MQGCRNPMRGVALRESRRPSAVRLGGPPRRLADVGHLIRTDVNDAPVRLEINEPGANPNAAHGLMVTRPFSGHPGHDLIDVVRWHPHSLTAGEDYFRCHQ